MKKGINYMRKRLSLNEISHRISSIASTKRKNSLRVQTEHNIQYIPYNLQRPAIPFPSNHYYQPRKAYQNPFSYY